MQMVTENMFDLTGKRGTRFFLENSIDGGTLDTKFSNISDDIHDARNVMAHRGYSGLQHRVEYFLGVTFRKRGTPGGTVLVNPDLYGEKFEIVNNSASVCRQIRNPV
jgi:hypothetical protein